LQHKFIVQLPNQL